MLVWGEGAGVDVDVGVDLDGGDADSASLEDGADTARYDALANPTDDTARHEDVLHSAATRGAHDGTLLLYTYLYQQFSKHQLSICMCILDIYMICIIYACLCRFE